MNHQRTSHRTMGAVSVMALVASLVLAGCAEDPEGVDPTLTPMAAVGGGGSGGSSTAGDNPESGDETGPESDDAEDGPGDVDPARAALTGGECLVGNWFVDNEQFGELMTAHAGTAVDNISGSTMVTFRDDGTTTTHYDEWTHTFTQDGATVTVVKDGADSGVYNVGADGAMTMDETDLQSTTTMEFEVDGNGVTRDAPARDGVFTNASFVCSGDELTVSADGATSVLYREH